MKERRKGPVMERAGRGVVQGDGRGFDRGGGRITCFRAASTASLTTSCRFSTDTAMTHYKQEL